MCFNEKMQVPKIDYSTHSILPESQRKFLQEQNDKAVKNPPNKYNLLSYSQIFCLIYHTLRIGIEINSIEQIKNFTVTEFFYSLHFLAEKNRIQDIILKDGKRS